MTHRRILHRSRWVFSSLLAIILLTGCGSADRNPDSGDSMDPAPSIDTTRPVVLGVVADSRIDEASGMVASRRFPGVFWIHNDSGDEARIYAVGSEGDSLGALTLAGAEHVDYEDIAWAEGEDGEPYLYVADMGDNDAERHHIVIYRFPEPASLTDFISPKVEALRFRYPDGPRDAETLIIDPLTGDLIIVTKREENVHVYSSPAPFSTEGITELTYHHTLPYYKIVAGDIHPDGSFVMVKDYDRIYGWWREDGQSIPDAMLNPATILPYVSEPQGEGLAFTHTGNGYVTVSEENDGIAAALALYPFRPQTNTPTAP